MRRPTLTLAVAAALAAVTTAQASGGPQEDLSACGAIADAAERLACYDRLAGRPAAPATPAPTGVPAAPVATAAPTATVPAAAPAGSAAAAPSRTAAPSQPPAATGQPAAAARPAATPGKAPAADAASFGSYAAEHPAVPAVPQTLSARVTEMGKTIDGRPTITLEGGALWLLDEIDPLLAVGDTVTIRRGVLGSFLLETQTRRLHHVRRIR